MKAVILAAGKGVRMRPLTEKVPKAMVKLKGRPLLEWNLDMFAELGIKEAALIVGYKKEIIKKHFGEEYRGIKITYLVQEEQLGTSHALLHAKEFVGEDEFLLVHCDVIVDFETMRELVEKDNTFNEFDILIVGREVEDPWRYGVLVFEGETIKDIVEKPPYGEAPSNVINAGLFRMTPKIFDTLEGIERSTRGEYELPDAIKKVISSGKVKLLIVREKCFDIGDLEDLKKAESELSG